MSGGVTWDFFRGSFRQNHVPWGRLSLRKLVPGISPGVKLVGAFGWRPTTLVVQKVEKIRGLNLLGTPRATSACRGIHLLYILKDHKASILGTFGKWLRKSYYWLRHVCLHKTTRPTINILVHLSIWCVLSLIFPTVYTTWAAGTFQASIAQKITLGNGIQVVRGV
jgi:hypothetical protein